MFAGHLSEVCGSSKGVSCELSGGGALMCGFRRWSLRPWSLEIIRAGE